MCDKTPVANRTARTKILNGMENCSKKRMDLSISKTVFLFVLDMPF